MSSTFDTIQQELDLLQERLAKDGKGESKSILIPLFGTGQGGASCAEVIKPMLSGLRSFFDDPDYGDLANVLDDVYFAAFTTPDVDAITNELSDAFS